MNSIKDRIVGQTITDVKLIDTSEMGLQSDNKLAVLKLSSGDWIWCQKDVEFNDVGVMVFIDRDTNEEHHVNDCTGYGIDIKFQ